MNTKRDSSKLREESLLRRWSERKIGKPNRLESDGEYGDIDSSSDGSGVEGTVRGDRLTTIKGDHPAFAELPDLLELKKLFKRPEISTLDGLNEYDRDYTDYSDLSGILTHEMKRKLALSLTDRIFESSLPDEPKTLDSNLSEFPDGSVIPTDSEQDS